MSLSNLLSDARLLKHAPSLRRLPEILGTECCRFLARCATGVRQVESAHPAETVDSVVTLSCPGAMAMQLHFDSRSRLSRGATLAIFMDARCSQEAFTFDCEDLMATEALCVPCECVWLRYRCHQNRDHAWGYKVRAVPLHWRLSNETEVARGPFELGWELLQLLVEESPGAFASAPMLHSLLRYLLYGRAPHKERVCLILLKALPEIDIEALPFESAAFAALERQVAWHDSLLRSRGDSLEAASTLPQASLCIVDLLVDLRERMVAAGITPWASSLGFMSEVGLRLGPAPAACAPSLGTPRPLPT